jgi:hypothetical protein
MKVSLKIFAILLLIYTKSGKCFFRNIKIRLLKKALN